MYMSITFDRWEKMRLIYLIVCLCMHPDISDIPPTLDYIIDFLFLDIINFPKVINFFPPRGSCLISVELSFYIKNRCYDPSSCA